MFPDAVTDADLVVPNRLEALDEVRFGGALPRALDDEIASVEVAQVKILGVSDALGMVADEAVVKPRALLFHRDRVGRRGIDLADIERRFRAADWLVGVEIATIVDRVDTRAVEFVHPRERNARLGQEGLRDQFADDIGIRGVEDHVRMTDGIEGLVNDAQLFQQGSDGVLKTRPGLLAQRCEADFGVLGDEGEEMMQRLLDLPRRGVGKLGR